MIVRLYKEKDVEVDLDNIIKYLNQVSTKITFKVGKENFLVKEKYLHYRDSMKYVTPKIENESKKDYFTLFISDKQYGDNYFFHCIDEDKKYLLSLFGWDNLTSYSKNTGIVYFIVNILALILDDSFRHHDDGNNDCVYNFGWRKTDIHEEIKSSSICEVCQDRIARENHDFGLLIEYIILILEDLRRSSRHYDDIVDYWISNKKEKIKLFFSYSHKDKNLLNEFKEHIQILEQNNLIDKWDDNELMIGDDWDSAIKEKMYSSDIIIFLLSPSSLSSKYIYEKELKIALHLKEMNKSYVAPILIRDCLWDMTAFKNFHVLPLDNKSVNSEINRDKAWVDVTKGLTKVIEFLLNKKNNLPVLNIKIESDEDLILYFFKTYSSWWFNIDRLINWGSNQDSFEKIKKIEKKKLLTILTNLLKTEKLILKISDYDSEMILYKYNKD